MVATVIAFIPGTTASQLLSNGILGNIWPNVLDADQDKGLQASRAVALETNSGLTIGQLVGSYPLSKTNALPCYASLLDYVQAPANFTDNTGFTVYNYSSAQPLKTVSQRLFYAIPYDWRLNNTASAALVAAALTQLDTVYAGTPYKLYIFAHSMGGLISRYVLEQANVQQYSWFSSLQALFTFGTPHLGAPLALAPMIGERLRSDETDFAVGFLKLTVNNSLFPSTYELLPPPAQNYITESGSSYTPSNLPDPAKTALSDYGFRYDTWTGTAVPFLNNLKPNPVKTAVPYRLFYGTGVTSPTTGQPATVTGYNYVSGGATASDSFVQQTGDGDGVVPTGSASLSTASTSTITRQPPYVGYTHGQLAGSDMAQHPQAIIDALTLAGLPVKSSMKSAAE